VDVAVWRHHLAINLTLAGSDATMAPSLPAAQPATYSFEGRTVRPLGNENDKAFALINALDDTQRSQVGGWRRSGRIFRRPNFAWSGATTNGAAYFRIQGPTLVIEYAPQNSVDHIHTIYRDPTNDYGAKFARK
jgi:hypothetical protein